MFVHSASMATQALGHTCTVTVGNGACVSVVLHCPNSVLQVLIGSAWF